MKVDIITATIVSERLTNMVNRAQALNLEAHELVAEIKAMRQNLESEIAETEEDMYAELFAQDSDGIGEGQVS